MAYHMKQLEDESSAGAKQSFADEQVRRQQETPRVGRLLSLYVDDSVADPRPSARCGSAPTRSCLAIRCKPRRSV